MKIVSFLLIATTPLVVSGLLTESKKIDDRWSQKSKTRIRGLLAFEEEDDLARKGNKRSKHSASKSSSEEEDGVAFGACAREDLQQFGIQCGVVEVPLDYNDPKGDTIQLAVSRFSHRDTEDYRGIILLNPGGPGVSGLLFAAGGLFLSDPIVAAKYDWIGWDPRGAGESIPSLACSEEIHSDYNNPPFTLDYMDEWLQKNQDFANACAEAHMDLLPHMSTVNNARDMDSIRQALGAEMMNFYGFSYGTSIGQVYATLYPEMVGKFVLDSVVDANQGAYEKGLDQMYEFEKVVDMFFDWTAQFDSVYGLGSAGSEVREKYLAARAELIGTPAGGLIGPAEFDRLFLLQIVDRHGQWLEGAQLLSDWVSMKNETQLIESYSPDASNNAFAGLLSVNCREEWQGWPEYSDAATDFARAFEDGAPLFAYLFAPDPCYSWGADPAPRFSVDRNYQHKILFITLEFDPRTPAYQAVDARDNFRNSVLVNVPGAVGHTESVLSGQTCLEGVVAEYLDSGSLPPRKPARGVADYDCVGKPLPDPTGPGRRAMEAVDTKLEELRRELLRELHRGHLG